MSEQVDVRVATFDGLVATLMARPAAVRLVAVDGPGGAGKSTFAARLATAAQLAGGPAAATVVHTDDFASWDVPLEWWPRLLEQVIEPLVAGREGRYQRYDWVDNRLAEWVDVPRTPIVVIEGVSAGRREWSAHLTCTVFVTTPEATRLQRGLDRDGDDQRDQWLEWMAAEHRHFVADGVIDRADLVVDGMPSAAHDADTEFVVVRG